MTRRALTLAAFFALFLVGAAPAHALTPEQRAFLGYNNQLRAENGVPAVQESVTLSRAAQNYADWLLANGKYGHYEDGRGPSGRAVAAGWPAESIDSVTENISTGGSGYDAYLGFDGSPPHRAHMLAYGSRSVGIGGQHGLWVVMYADECPAGAEPQCALDGDIGDINAVTSAPDPESLAEQPLAERSAGLSLGKFRVDRNRVLRVTATMVSGAQGTAKLRITDSSGRHRYVRALRHTGRTYSFRTHLPHRGRYVVQARFTGGRGWADKRTQRTLHAR